MRSGSGEDFGEKGIEAVCELLNPSKTGGA